MNLEREVSGGRTPNRYPDLVCAEDVRWATANALWAKNLVGLVGGSAIAPSPLRPL